MNPASLILGSKWISATTTRNFILNNKLSDLISEYVKRKNGYGTKDFQFDVYGNGGNFGGNTGFPSCVQFLMEQGNIFERNIFTRLKNKFSDHEYIDLKGNVRSKLDFERTRDAIFSKVPIIFGGVLHDEDNKIFGLPDILVREDYLDKIFNTLSTRDTSHDPASRDRARRMVSYAVIDVKFTTLMLTSCGENILNSGNFPCYKAQIEFYRRIVNKLCNSNFNYGYVLGRGWQRKQKGILYSSRDPFDRPGVIDYLKNDRKFVKQTTEAIKWMKKVKSLKTEELEKIFESSNLQKSIPVAPNMCISNEPSYISTAKKQINDYLCDVTQVWMCGYKHSILAKSLGIKGWTDPKFSASALGFSGKLARCIDAIVEVNKPTNNRSIIFPENLNFKECVAKNKRAFIDFEVLADISCDGKFSNQSIFMIGVGYELERGGEGEFVFETFTTTDFTSRGETEICRRFVDFIHEKGLGDHTFIHWSSAENWQWENARKRLSHNTHLKLYDLCKFFQDNAIAVNGCFNYSLKSVAKSMKNLYFIETSWDTSSGAPSDGLDAVVNLYTSSVKSRQDAERCVRQIEQYNYVDVKVLHEICNYLDKISE
jgi:hypothetical protein